MSELRHFRYIDALRGWAFLGVLTVHVAYELPDWSFEKYFIPAQYGVQLFYLLSAITLLRSMAVRGEQEKFPLGNYFIRRFFRIAPLFWLAIAVYLWRDGFTPWYWAPDGIHAVHILTAIFFVHGWLPTTINAIVPGGWSVAVEMTFYLCLPFLAARVKTAWTGLSWAFYAMLGGMVLNRLMLVLLPHFVAPSAQYLDWGFLFCWFPNQLSIFLLGMATYHALHHEGITRFIAQRGRALLLMAAAVYALIALTKSDTGSLLPLFIIDTLLFMLIILTLHARPLRVAVNRLTCGLGTISYSCYLTHFLCLSYTILYIRADTFKFLSPSLAPLVHFLTLWIATLLLTALVSTVTYYLIEKPGIRLGSWIIRQREKKPALSIPRPS